MQMNIFFLLQKLKSIRNAFAEDSPCSATLWRLHGDSAATALRFVWQWSRSQIRQSVRAASLFNMRRSLTEIASQHAPI